MSIIVLWVFSRFFVYYSSKNSGHGISTYCITLTKLLPKPEFCPQPNCYPFFAVHAYCKNYITFQKMEYIVIQGIKFGFWNNSWTLGLPGRLAFLFIFSNRLIQPYSTQALESCWDPRGKGHYGPNVVFSALGLPKAQNWTLAYFLH